MAFRAYLSGLILALCLAASAHAVVPELRQPAWTELSLEQKQILAPLSRDWDNMEAYRKKKWLGIAKRYPRMSPGEQARVQSQMRDWATLTPDQRKQAREQYKNLKKASPEKKEAIRQKWEQYQNLSEEEKKRLAEKAAKKRSPKHGIVRTAPVQKVPASITPPLPALAAPVDTAAQTPAATSIESEPAPPPAAAPPPDPQPQADQASPGTAPGATPAAAPQQ